MKTMLRAAVVVMFLGALASVGQAQESVVGVEGELGGPKSVQHASGRFAMFWDWTMDPEKRYTITLTSGDFDTLLTLQEGNRRIHENDDFGGTLNSQLVFSPTKFGTYRIVATSFAANARGKFYLQVKEERRMGPLLPGGDTEVVVNGQLQAPNATSRDRKEHFFAVTKGMKYTLDLQSGSGRTVAATGGNHVAPPGFFDTVLRIEWDRGGAIGGNDDVNWPQNSNSQYTFTAADDGTIRVIVSSFRDGENGPYRLSFRR